MDAKQFDRVARALARPASRRGVLALAGGLVAARLRGTHAAPATQQGPATCGTAGDVCTMLLGCCEGLTCVTSAINVNYGVCVSGGDGGTVASGTSLISPFSENLEQEIGTIEATDPTTIDDIEAEREQRKAAKEARKDRKETRRNSRRTEQKNRREDNKDEKEIRRGPRLEVSLSVPPVMDSLHPEVVAVTNDTDGSVFIERINTLQDERVDGTLSRTLSQGDTIYFLSGIPLHTEVEDDEFLWLNQYVCDDPNDGFEVTTSFSSSSDIRVYTVLCSGPPPEDSGSTARRKRRQRKKRQQAKDKKKRRGKNGKNRKHKKHHGKR